jgi:hypothetical protein
MEKGSRAADQVENSLASPARILSAARSNAGSKLLSREISRLNIRAGGTVGAAIDPAGAAEHIRLGVLKFVEIMSAIRRSPSDHNPDKSAAMGNPSGLVAFRSPINPVATTR